MVDRFVYGEVTRVSPEAPVPVLARSHELMMLGAAGNVARNVAALDGEVALVGAGGRRSRGAGEALRLIGDETGIEGFLVTDPSRPTTLKTRFVSGGQQLLRVDLGGGAPADGDVAARLVGHGGADACRDAAVVADFRLRQGGGDRWRSAAARALRGHGHRRFQGP